MLSLLIETIVETLAELGVERGMRRAGRFRGVISVGVLLVLGVGLALLGVFLLKSGEPLWIAVLIWVIAAFFLFLAAWMVGKALRVRLSQRRAEAPPEER